jgi:hypothetical protein
VADSSEPSEVTEEQATRLVLRTIAAVVAFVLAAGVVVVAQRADRDELGDEPVVGGAGGDPASGFVGGDRAIGPLQGIELPTYREERRKALAEAAGRRAAVVSFARYVTEADVERLLAEVADIEPRSLLVAAPGGIPAVVDDLEDWASDQRREAKSEREELERLLPTIEDEEFLLQYRSDIDRLRRLETSVDPKGAVVFGAVVVADADDLRALAGLDGVRLVDVGVGDDVPREDEARGLRPEEVVEAGEPPSRPV